MTKEEYAEKIKSVYGSEEVEKVDRGRGSRVRAALHIASQLHDEMKGIDPSGLDPDAKKYFDRIRIHAAGAKMLLKNLSNHVRGE